MPRKTVPFLLLVLLLLPISGFAGSRACPDQPDVVVMTDNPSDLPEICNAAGKAIDFLSRYNLKPIQPIVIEIVEEVIDSHGQAAYGNYDGSSDLLKVMSYAAIFATSKNPLMFGEPFDRVHYSGVIAHEVAHAVTRHYIKDERYSMAPQEYIAYVTQLAVLPEERRAAIIRAMDVGPWEGGDSISHIYMALNPGKFAVKSYLHLMSLANQTAFVQILLNNNWFYVYVPKSG